MTFFPDVESRIAYEGPESDNPLASRTRTGTTVPIRSSTAIPLGASHSTMRSPSVRPDICIGLWISRNPGTPPRDPL